MSEISQKFLKLLFCFMLCISTKTFAQSPELNIKGVGSEKVRMSQLIVNVKVVGNFAYTTAEMHFFNSGTRQMEAELIFPLPENVSVSRYAIDINGKMREAVPVNKNKGKQVFEAIEHRRVDPGLLEKVEGNNFRTRIYPLLPNGERIVIIGYEEELSAFDKNNLSYQLVSRYPEKLDKFEINVSVLGTSSAPKITENSGNVIAFSKWNQSFQTSFKKENYKPSEKLVFKIPIQENVQGVLIQNVGGQYYFYGNTFVDNNKIAKKTPNSIGLIWDNSLSCQNRDLEKELSLLDAYFQKIKNTKVTLYFLNYTFEKQKDYIISNGNWTELRSVLENAKYDGGTRFSQINFPDHDEYLFFSDGLSSLSDNVLPNTKKQINTITSSVSADFAFLNYSAMQTAGNFINLNQINPENALDKLVNNSLKFLGIKENFTVTDLFPIQGTSVSGSFSFSGISLSAKNEVTLLFGYNNEAVLERKITLNAGLQNTTDVNVEKLWAQKKIANLDFQYAKNAEEIETLGKKYGIVTKNTSLIVLENIRDYVMYNIIPPVELREEFDRIKKQENDNNLALQKSNWESVDNFFTNLKSWWEKDIKYTEPKVGEPSKLREVVIIAPYKKPIKKYSSSAIQSITVENTSRRAKRRRVIESDNVAIAAAPVAEIVENNVTGNSQQGNEVIQEESSYLKNNFSNSDKIIYENVDIQYSHFFRHNFTDDVNGGVVGNSDISLNEPIARGAIPEIMGNDEQVGQQTFRFRGDRLKNEYKDKLENSGNGNIQNQIKTWNPDRLYLKALAEAPKEKQYELYFILRQEQERNPSFYFDVAHFFYNQGNVKKLYWFLVILPI